MLDGALGYYTGSEYKIELLEGAKSYRTKLFLIPKIQESTIKIEVNRLIIMGVIKRENSSKWAAPTYIIPKKNGTVRFISDFRDMNKWMKRNPFPIKKYKICFFKLEGFKCASSLELNMVYYHIKLCSFSRKLYTIVFSWGINNIRNYSWYYVIVQIYFKKNE